MECSYDAFLRQASNASSVSATKEIILDFYCTNGKFLALLLGPHGDPQFLSAAKVRVKKTLKSILNIPSCDFETEIFIEMASSAIISMLTYWYDNQESVSLHQVIGTGSRFLQRGLIPYFRQRDMNFSHIDFGE